MNSERCPHSLWDQLRSAVQRLPLATGALVKEHGVHQCGPSCAAISAEVQQLLAAGAQEHLAPSTAYPSPLHWAAGAGCRQLVATLLQAGAEVTSVTIQCYTVLHAAASSGSAALVQQMLDAHGSKARSSLRYLGRSAATAPYCTPLHLAVAEGFKEVVEVLIAAGAEVNKQDSEGAAPLHAAIAGNHQGLAEVLLAAGAGVNGQDTKGVTPLHLAAAAGLQEMVELLLAAGAGKELQDSQGCTPLHRALLAAVADVDAASHRQVQAAIAAGGG